MKKIYKPSWAWQEEPFKRLDSPYGYFQHDPRRKEERIDAAMIQEDNNAVANLPERFIHAEFPKSYSQRIQYLSDWVNGYDIQRVDIYDED